MKEGIHVENEDRIHALEKRIEEQERELARLDLAVRRICWFLGKMIGDIIADAEGEKHE